MPTTAPAIEKPRKLPIQARSVATVDAILDAVIQVLIREGKARLTTTRVAERAGVSVGTLYQYFPNKRSLLQATLRRKLEGVTAAVERACAAHHDQPLCAIVSGVVEAFFRAKMRDPAASRALYAVSSDVDGLRISDELRQRSTTAWIAALESAPERLTIPVESAVAVLQAAMTGLSRQILESQTPVRDHTPLKDELIAMACTYIDARRA